MTYFQNLTPNDLVTYEGRHVSNVAAEIDKHSKEITHYRMSVPSRDGDIEIRKFRPDEVRHLIDAEIMEVQRGYYNPMRMRDRELYGGREVNGANAQQRQRVDLAMQQCRLMERYYGMGMKLTIEGVEQFRAEMVKDYETYQARKYYGTQKANQALDLHRFCSGVLLMLCGDFFECHG